MGNYGSAESGVAPSRAITIGPDILKVTPKLLNGTGVEKVSFAPGETLRVEADVRYNDKNARESVVDPNPVDPYSGPLTLTRGGVVKAHIGWGFFNATTSTYANLLVNLTLSYDSASQKWYGTYTVPTSTANLTAVQAVISASDGANAPNTGSAFTTQFTVQAPPTPVTIEVPVTVEKSTGFELPMVAGLAIVLLIVGLGVGMMLSRGKKASSPPEEPRKED